MPVKKVRLPWGENQETGRLVHVDAVPNGKASGCVCPACGSLLVAKNNGLVKIHHFAHYFEAVSCEGWLHATAKLALFERIRGALLQARSVPVAWQCQACPCRHTGNLLRKADDVGLEKGITEGDISFRPDVTTFFQGIPTAFHEIVDTHKPEARTHQYAEEKGFPLLVYRVETEEDIEVIRERTLSPQAFYVPCYCNPCSKCDSRLCPGRAHRFCEWCHTCVDEVDGLLHRYCQQCRECWVDYADYCLHAHCLDCGNVFNPNGRREYKYTRCFCCFNSHQFNLPACKLQNIDHRHCKKCGHNTRKNRYGEFWELCYPCYQKESDEAGREATTTSQPTGNIAHDVWEEINRRQTDSTTAKAIQREAEEWDELRDWFKKQRMSAQS